MTIRVLHIIGSLRLGGAQVVVKQIVEHNNDPEIEHFVYPLRCRQIDIPIKGNLLSNPYRNYDPRKFFDILRICKQHNINIIHAHLHKPIMGALLASCFEDIPVIVHEHGSIARPGIQYSFYRLALKLLRKRARLFIAVSNAASKQLTTYAKIEPERIKVVYNAVDLETFTPEPVLRQSVRNDLGISSDDIAIGFVGRLAYVKGPDILLEAFAGLLEKRPNCVLVFLGDGPMKPALISKATALGISSRVILAGFKKNVARCMNAFDLAAITSRQEAFGLAAIELMSMRTPLVSCNIDGLGEIVSHHINALVPDENSPGHICDCMLELIDNPELKRSLSEHGPVSAKEFGIDRLIKEINDIYKSTINELTATGQHP